MESRISQRKTYLIEIMYHENHNTEVTTITTDNINWLIDTSYGTQGTLEDFF